MQNVDTSQLTSGLVLGEDIIKGDKVILKKHKILDDSSIKIIKNECSHCKILSLSELEPAITNKCSFSDKYIHFLVNNFNLLYSSVFDNTAEFIHQANYVAKELSSNRQALVSLLKLRSNHLYTYSHSTNVALLSLEVGYQLELYDTELHNLVFGAILHDLGKLYIDNKILDKPGKLSDEEFNIIKQHPTIGYTLAHNLVDLNTNILCIIKQHHEKLDGSGYPYGLVGNEINDLAKIVTVCDIYDAITSDRSYHKARSYEVCAKMLNSDVRKGKLDSYVVNALVSKTVVYSIDTFVRLNNGVSGFVVAEDLKSNRPIIYDCINRRFYNLKKCKDLKIIYAV